MGKFVKNRINGQCTLTPFTVTYSPSERAGMFTGIYILERTNNLGTRQSGRRELGNFDYLVSVELLLPELHDRNVVQCFVVE